MEALNAEREHEVIAPKAHQARTCPRRMARWVRPGCHSRHPAKGRMPSMKARGDDSLGSRIQREGQPDWPTCSLACTPMQLVSTESLTPLTTAPQANAPVD